MLKGKMTNLGVANHSWKDGKSTSASFVQEDKLQSTRHFMFSSSRLTSRRVSQSNRQVSVSHASLLQGTDEARSIRANAIIASARPSLSLRSPRRGPGSPIASVVAHKTRGTTEAAPRQTSFFLILWMFFPFFSLPPRLPLLPPPAQLSTLILQLHSRLSWTLHHQSPVR